MWLVCFVVIVWFVFGVYLLTGCGIAVWYLFVGCWLFGGNALCVGAAV